MNYVLNVCWFASVAIVFCFWCYFCCWLFFFFLSTISPTLTNTYSSSLFFRRTVSTWIEDGSNGDDDGSNSWEKTTTSADTRTNIIRTENCEVSKQQQKQKWDEDFESLGNGIPTLISKNVSFNTGNNN